MGETREETTSIPEQYANASLLCNKERGIVLSLDVDASQNVNTFWLVICLLVIVGNMTVMTWRCLSRKELRYSIPSILVMNLAISDFLFGIQLLVYVLMSGDWLCSAWVSPNNVQRMTSLCSLCGFLETTSIFASAMTGGTIALYYAAVFFGRLSRTVRFSSVCIKTMLCTEWIIALIESMTVVPYQFGPYQVKTQSRPSHSTFSVIFPGKCLSVSKLHLFSANTKYSILPVAVVFLVMCGFVLTTAGAYIAIVIKVLQARASSALLANVSTSVNRLSQRLVAIAVITLLGWITAAAFFFVNFSGFWVSVPFAFVALSNPLTFTLTSRPFMNAVKKFKQMACFKIGKPIPIEDVTNDSESLLPTGLIPSDTDTN